MPAVYTFTRSDNEILQDLLLVFSAERSSREQWSVQAELLVEPVGWVALWKLSKKFCKYFGKILCKTSTLLTIFFDESFDIQTQS